MCAYLDKVQRSPELERQGAESEVEPSAPQPKPQRARGVFVLAEESESRHARYADADLCLITFFGRETMKGATKRQEEE